MHTRVDTHVAIERSEFKGANQGRAKASVEDRIAHESN